MDFVFIASVQSVIVAPAAFQKVLLLRLTIHRTLRPRRTILLSFVRWRSARPIDFRPRAVNKALALLSGYGLRSVNHGCEATMADRCHISAMPTSRVTGHGPGADAGFAVLEHIALQLLHPRHRCHIHAATGVRVQAHVRGVRTLRGVSACMSAERNLPRICFMIVVRQGLWWRWTSRDVGGS